MRRILFLIVLSYMQGALAADAPTASNPNVQGLTIFGNRESPKAMVVMPWRDATQGDMAGFRLENALAEELEPIDPDLFKYKVDLSRVLKEKPSP